MPGPIIRPAFSSWPAYNARLRDVVADLTAEELALRPTPERWPIWASIGHAACQRVFWLCDFAGEPGAGTTRFTNAMYDCPGDDDLEHVLSADDLVEALDSTFRIVEVCLDRWTIDSLDQTATRPRADGTLAVHTRASVLNRMISHDAFHGGEISQLLGLHHLEPIDFWIKQPAK